jgi:hypothetical protein
MSDKLSLGPAELSLFNYWKYQVQPVVGDEDDLKGTWLSIPSQKILK